MHWRFADRRDWRDWYKPLVRGAGHWRRLHWPTLLLVSALVAVGVLFIYGNGEQTRGVILHAEYRWLRQLQWVVLGTIGGSIVALLDQKWLERWAPLLYLGSVALLTAVWVPGIGVRLNNASAWVRVAPGVTLQPAELVKIGTILMLAWLGSRSWLDASRVTVLIPFAAAVGLPLVLILKQPDLGSALVFAPVTVAILWVSGLRLRWLAIGLALVLVLGPVAFAYGLKDYQRRRVLTFAGPLASEMATAPWLERIPGGARARPWLEELSNHADTDWNTRQSLLAVGSGGWRGKGFLRGTQNTLGFLPRTVAPTDFIFSVIAEETGFVGAVGLLGLYTLLLLGLLYIAARAAGPFGRNLAVGVAAMLATHLVVNLGMTIGVMPIIGIPLPFISYGGSFMMAALAGIGLCQGVYCHRPA